MNFEPLERKRYSRQIILPEIGLEGQNNLKSSRILVVGAGGLGCPVLQYLTAAGVGTIGIVDDDRVELTNLHRQILYGTEDIGKSKAKTAGQKLSALNEHTVFEIFEKRLTSENAIEILKNYDLVIDGSDNFETRYVVNDACLALNLPFIMGSILRFEGQVSVFNYQNGPTCRCLFPDAEAGESCADAGVIGILPGVIGSLMANEAIKVICGIGEVLSGKLLILNTLNMQTRLFKFNRNLPLPSSEIPSPVMVKEKTGHTKEMTWDDFEAIREHSPEEWHLIDVREVYEFESDDIGGE